MFIAFVLQQIKAFYRTRELPQTVIMLQEHLMSFTDDQKRIVLEHKPRRCVVVFTSRCSSGLSS